MRNCWKKTVVPLLLSLCMMSVPLMQAFGAVSAENKTDTQNEAVDAGRDKGVGVGDTDIFANKKLRDMVDENHAEVEKEGWAELRIPVELHNITEDDLDPNAVDAAKKLMDEGYQAYIVGGAIRDMIMGKKANDFDIATDAPNDEIERILNDVSFHDVGDMTFAYAQYPDEVIDVATFYNMPASYAGHKGIPDIDLNERKTDDPRNDSFRRDFTMNALYYDMSNGDLVTWQGGLYDLKEGIIESITDPEIEFKENNDASIRGLRFKARYGYDFSDRLEEVFRNEPEKYLKLIGKGLLASQLHKLFDGGYAEESYKVLSDYDVFTYFFPALADISDVESLDKRETGVMKGLDRLYEMGEDIDRAMIVGSILFPAVLEKTKDTDLDDAMEQVLDMQEKVYDFRDGEREEIKELTRGIFESIGSKADAPEENSFFEGNDKLNEMLDKNHEKVQKDGWAELRIPQEVHGFTDKDMSKNVLDAGKKLTDAGYEAYVVGGAVRDLIMGKEANDFDIVTSATPEECEEVIGEMKFHETQEGLKFGIKEYPDESIDVATFQNIPKFYKGLENIPDFDEDALYGSSLMDDSFERDLPMNALYYDLGNGDLVDYHDGIWQIREKVMDTMVDPKIVADNNSTVPIRALRFKARYGYDFSDRLDETLRKYGRDYIKALNPLYMGVQLEKMWDGGYSVEMYNTLMDYDVFDIAYPPAADIFKTDEYKDFVLKELKKMDEAYENDEEVDARKSVAIFMYPVVKELAKEKGFSKAMKETLDELGETYEYLDDDRYIIEDCLRGLEVEERIKEVIWDLFEEYEEEKAA